MPARSSASDPLSMMLAPPPNETEAQRAARLEAEVEAKRVSDMIDEELQRQEKADKRGPKAVKILLLGQSESGKSTTLKNFQLLHSPKAFKAERASWRAVVQLNVVRSMRLILEVMAQAQAALHSPSSGFFDDADGVPQLPTLTADHLKLKMRLSPLLQVEETLVRKLNPAGSVEREATQLARATEPAAHLDAANMELARARSREVAINSQFAWKGMFSKLVANPRGSFESDAIDWDDPQDPGRILHACRDDMIALWNDPTIRELLEVQKVRLQDVPGFFLDDLARITSPRYVPTDDDILRARLKTLGVSEYRFTIREGRLHISREWRIFDVGGHRSLRAAWAPYFDDMDAIIFLAPISCFDQVLDEDPSVNRVEDSVLLWRSIVSNVLLANTSVVLFLNKVDILQAKLDAGIRFGSYIVSYGNRPNNYENASQYMRRKFAQILKDYSPTPRTFYQHFTTATDTKQTTEILRDVQDTIVQRNLKSSKLIS
ncbi:G-alpha-domain-containing protein [Obba rivulosa]|uniref:G-alpha-domain-containing protein n=1 Tax=Obba rivulosa TaxID=1052685 RepID=A0A8E2AMF8_9APHY|nr:G-alpha-domain-containing protein [Obba rivulosa]